MSETLKKSFSYALLAYSQLVLFGLVGVLVTGFAYYGFVGEGDWKCYATQNDSIREPWDITQGPVPDDFHHVNANFKVVCIWGVF